MKADEARALAVRAADKVLPATTVDVVDEAEVSLPGSLTSPVDLKSGAAVIPMTLPDVGANRSVRGPGGVVVNDGADADIVVRPAGERVQIMTVLADQSAPTSYRYCLPGSELAALPDGSVAVFEAAAEGAAAPAVRVQAQIEKPWAVDAGGRGLPTQYAVAGTCLTQTIDTRGAAFPVVADPSVDFVKWFPPTWVITLNPKDQRIILSSGGAAVGALVGAALCSEGTPVASAVCAAAGAVIVTAVSEAFKEYGVKEGCNWKVRWSIKGGVKDKWRSGKC